MTATPSGERRTRSHSQLSDYLHCPYYFFLKRVKKLPERPAVWNAGGTAFHVASEAFDKAHIAIAGQAEFELTAEIEAGFRKIFLQEFERELEKLREREPDETKWRRARVGKTKSLPDGENADWWRKNGPDMVIAYIQWRLSTVDILKLAALESGPAIEVEVRTSLGGVPVLGYVDRVFEDINTGVLLLVDIKSGARDPETDLQLGTYSVMLELLTGLQVTWGAFYKARKGQLRGEPVDLTNYTAETLGDLYAWFDNQVEAGFFPPNITPLCKACGMREHCKYQIEGGTETE